MSDRTLVQRYITDGNPVNYEAWIARLPKKRKASFKKKGPIQLSLFNKRIGRN